MANEFAAQCASFKMQIDSLGGESKAREHGMGSIVDTMNEMCKDEDTQKYIDQALSGTLYCSSGDLCGQYDFTHSSDRALYVKSCNQVAACPSNYKDECSATGDKVKGGVGRVDWTLYSYVGKIPDNAKNGNCQ